MDDNAAVPGEVCHSTPYPEGSARRGEDGSEAGSDPEEYTVQEESPGKRRFSALDGWGNELGYAVVHEKPGYVWLHILYVHPDDRGRGTARQLLENVISHFPDRDIRLHPHPFLEGWEREDQLGPDTGVLRDFYGRHGFDDYRPQPGDEPRAEEHMIRPASAGHEAAEDNEESRDLKAGSAPGGRDACPWELTAGDKAALVELPAQITHSVGRCADGITEAGGFGIPAGQQLREAAKLAGQSWRRLQRAVTEAGFGTAAMGFPARTAPAARAAALIRRTAARVAPKARQARPGRLR